MGTSVSPCLQGDVGFSRNQCQGNVGSSLRSGASGVSGGDSSLRHIFAGDPVPFGEGKVVGDFTGSHDDGAVLQARGSRVDGRAVGATIGTQQQPPTCSGAS